MRKLLLIFVIAAFAINSYGQYETINLPIEIYRFGGNVNSFITNQHNPFMYSTSHYGSTFPFTGLGHLVIQPRTSTLRDILFVTGDGDDIRMAIKGAGNIGIGTTEPSEKLEIYNSTTTPGIISLKSARNDAMHVDVGRVSAKQNSVEVARIGIPRAGQTNSGYFTFWTKSNNAASLTEKVRIDANGNVGIGTNSPTYSLDIASSSDKLMKVTAKGAGWGGTSLFEIYSERNVAGSNPLLQVGSAYAPNSFRITSSGNVGIGTTNPQSLLAVNGTITSTEVVVTTEGWSDFVFNPDYKLKDLEEVESFIAENKHLPDVPSESEVLENGVALGEMDATLLQKIEELTLYMIEMNKEMKVLRSENSELKERMEKMEAKN